MKRFTVNVLALSTLLIAGLASTAEHEVKMLSSGADGIMVFEPAVVQAEPGDTVRFVPADSGHNSVSAYVPDGAETWDGSINEEITVTLSQEGVYLYQCDPHLVLGMVGVIQVGDAVNMEAARSEAKRLSDSMAQNSERFEDYLNQL